MLIAFAQIRLEEFSGWIARDCGHKFNGFRYPELGELPREICLKLVDGHIVRRLQDDDRRRTLRPFRWGTAITAASPTAGCPIRAPSNATELIHSPPDLTRSLRDP